MVCSRLSTLFPPVVVLCAHKVQLCLTHFETEVNFLLFRTSNRDSCYRKSPKGCHSMFLSINFCMVISPKNAFFRFMLTHLTTSA